MRRTKSLALGKIWITLLMVSAVSPAVAAEDWEITPFAGFRFGGGVEEIETGRSLSFDRSAGWGLTVGRWLGEETRIELTWSQQPTELEVVGFGVDINYLQVAGVYEPSREEKAGGYVLVSVGATLFDPDESGAGSETFISGSIGGGGRFRLSDRLSLRLEARGYGTLTSGSGGVFCSGGCVFAFSGSGMFQLELSAGLAIAF